MTNVLEFRAVGRHSCLLSSVQFIYTVLLTYISSAMRGGGGGGGERRCFIKDQILNLIAFISVIIESYFSNIVKMKRVLCTQS